MQGITPRRLSRKLVKNLCYDKFRLSNWIWSIITCLSLFTPRSVLAIAAPILSSPQNQATVSSTRLEWQAVEGAIDYRVVIDDEPTVSGTYLKSSYKTTTNYSPKLDPGTYYWQVRARDLAKQWSGWSEVRSFNLIVSPSLINTSPVASPVTFQSVSPTPSPSIKPIPIFSQTPNLTSIDSTDLLEAAVLLSGFTPKTDFYLKGVFIKENSSNYFGKTKVNQSWIKNSMSYQNQIKITTDDLGNWNGTVSVMVDLDDSGFGGNGSYIFKVGRYDTDGSNLTWSNNSQIKITEVVSVSVPELDQEVLTNPSTSSSPVPQLKIVLAGNKQVSTSSNKKIPDLNYRSASVAAATSSATQNIIKAQTSLKSYFIMLAGIICIFLSLLIYFKPILMRMKK